MAAAPYLRRARGSAAASASFTRLALGEYVSSSEEAREAREARLGWLCAP